MVFALEISATKNIRLFTKRRWPSLTKLSAKTCLNQNSQSLTLGLRTFDQDRVKLQPAEIELTGFSGGETLKGLIKSLVLTQRLTNDWSKSKGQKMTLKRFSLKRRLSL